MSTSILKKEISEEILSRKGAIRWTFTNPDILLGDKLLEILYIVMGLVLIYTGVRNLTDKTNPHRYGSAFSGRS